MKIALNLANKTTLITLPNPSVGALVVKNNHIVGRGYTQHYGGMHAEAVALQEAGAKAKGADLYCSLEPCHGTWKGKTQVPCTSLIIKAGIRAVYIACKDSHVKVDGKGIKFLRSKGISVTMCKEFEVQAKKLNEVFEYLQYQQDYPFIHVKVAQSLDARMTGANNTRIAITDSYVQKKVHTLRSKYQVLITGINTIKIDNPFLDTRLHMGHARGKAPQLIVLDSKLSLDPQSNIFTVPRRILSTIDANVIVFTSHKGYTRKKKILALEHAGAHIIPVDSCTHKRTEYLDLHQVCSMLRANYNIYSAMVEAGPRVTSAVFNAKLASKCTCFVAPHILREGNGFVDYLAEALLDPLHVYHTSSTKIKNSNNFMIESYLYDYINKE